MIILYYRNWWMIVLRGALASVVGLIALILPGATVVALARLFGIFLAVDGVLTVISTLGGARKEPGRRLALLEGGLAVAIGVLTFIWPRVTVTVLVILIGAWAVLGGILRLAGAVRRGRQGERDWRLLLTGALAVILGLALWAFDNFGAIAIGVLIGVFLLLIGVSQIVLGFRLRRGIESS
ncbi:MAG: DUF308 domain-containing protein [Spirochaetales bacterium]|nr:DUF308 domain-containing protein [Spirochaetales bacterium]